MNNLTAQGRRQERRQRHHELSRAQLLDAAEEVFGRKGFHDTTLREIAELAEFSVGSVYSFFQSKDDLFRSIFSRRGEQFMDAMRAVLDLDGDPARQIHELVDMQVGFFRSHPHFGRLYLRYATSAGVSEERLADTSVAANYDESMALQAVLFARGQAAGIFRDGDPVVLARLFSGLMSAYQAVDPAVVADPPATERLKLAALHEIVTGAFAPR